MGSGDKNTKRSGGTVTCNCNQRGERREGRRRKTFWRHLNTKAQGYDKRENHELRLATKHFLHCLQVPEVRLCARKTFPSWGALQHIKGDGAECERIQGGSPRVDRGPGTGRQAEERPAVDGQASCHLLLQISSGH